MRLPRDLSGAELVKRLGRMGYTVSRQAGSRLVGRPTIEVQWLMSPLARWSSLGGHKWSTLGGRQGGCLAT